MANQALQERIKKTQDENWLLLTVLGMSWEDTRKLSEYDRGYLLLKAEEIKQAHEQRKQLLTDSNTK
jgi:DNA polymerase III delta prime subunit